MRLADTRGLLTEAEFQRMVVDRAHARGWLVHHDRGDYRQAIAGDPGFPDLVLARAGRVVVAELKSARGKVVPAQAEWLRALTDPAWLTTFAVHVWRPDDWPEVCEVIDEA